jgi:hypothetical protein
MGRGFARLLPQGNTVEPETLGARPVRAIL